METNMAYPSSFTLEANNWKSISLAESLFLLSLISMFLPVKIYPVLFIISSFFFYRETPNFSFQKWAVALAVFSTYALLSFLVTSSSHPLALTYLTKLFINFIFLYFGVNWLGARNNESLILKLDAVLFGVLVLSLIQLLIYHQAYNFNLILGSGSSGQASSLYKPTLFYWGLEDKNMFGARIALMGFVFICLPILLRSRLSFWRICFVFLLGFLSLSRTPIIALLIGVFFLVWISVEKKWKIILLIVVLIALPVVLEKVIRVDSLTSSNDGMGIRLVYWKAFFTHFSAISPLGNGFLSAPEFLESNAEFYRGEPHIHNTFLSTYLEMGLIGLFSYLAFLSWFAKECLQKMTNTPFWIALFLPILSIMMILYSGYDNDVVMYLALIFLVGTFQKVDFKNIQLKL